MARDYTLTAIVPNPSVRFLDQNGDVSQPWRLFFEATGVALFGETGDSDVTQGLDSTGSIELGTGTTGNYVKQLSGDPTKGLNVAGGTGEGTTNAITLAQDIQASASPTFNNITVTGTVDGRDVAADGAALDALPATIAAKVSKTSITAISTDMAADPFADELKAKINEIITALA